MADDAKEAGSASSATATSNDQIIECQILSYEELDKAAARIAAQIAEKNIKAVVIHNEREAGAQTELRSVETYLGLLSKHFDDEIKAAQKLIDDTTRPDKGFLPDITLGAITEAVKAATDLLALFKTEVTLSHKSWDAAETTLVAALAKHLQEKVVVYHPTLSPLDLSGIASALMGKIEDLLRQRGTIEGLLATFGMRLKPKKNAKGDKSSEPADPSKIEIAQMIGRLKEAAKECDTFHAALLQADNTGLSLLARLLRAEQLRGIGDGYRLALKVTAIGGGVRTESGLFVKGSGVLYSGGTIAEFMLFDKTGKITASDVVRAFSGFHQKPRPE